MLVEQGCDLFAGQVMAACQGVAEQHVALGAEGIVQAELAVPVGVGGRDPRSGELDHPADVVGQDEVPGGA